MPQIGIIDYGTVRFLGVDQRYMLEYSGEKLRLSIKSGHKWEHCARVTRWVMALVVQSYGIKWDKPDTSSYLWQDHQQ